MADVFVEKHFELDTITLQIIPWAQPQAAKRAYHASGSTDDHGAVLAAHYRGEADRRQHVHVRLLAAVHLQVAGLRANTPNRNKKNTVNRRVGRDITRREHNKTLLNRC